MGREGELLGQKCLAEEVQHVGPLRICLLQGENAGLGQYLFAGKIGDFIGHIGIANLAQRGAGAGPAGGDLAAGGFEFA